MSKTKLVFFCGEKKLKDKPIELLVRPV